MHLGIDNVLDEPSPELEITVVSPNTTFRVGLSRDLFEDHLKNVGPDYVLRVLDAGQLARLIEELKRAEFRESGCDESIDIRFRLALKSQNRISEAIYVDRFGKVFQGGKTLCPTGKRNWFPMFWDLVKGRILP